MNGESRQVETGSGRWGRTTLGVVVAGLVLVAAAGYLFFSYASPEAVRELTERRLSALTGREVTITGDFDYVVSLTPTFTAQQLSIANADWGTHSDMLTAEAVAVELAILPLLLGGDVEIDRFVIERAEIILERGPEGQLNWQPDPVVEDEASPTPPGSGENRPVLAVRELEILDSSVVWRRQDGSDEVAMLARLAWQAEPADDALVVEATGRYAEQPFTVQGSLGTLAALTAADAPSPLDLEIGLGTTRLLVEGDAELPLDDDDTDLALVLTGEGDVLSRLLDAAMPALGAWQLAAAVRGGEGALTASDVAGRAELADGLVFAVTGGTIEDLVGGTGISLPATVEAPSLAAVEPLVETDLPELGAFHAEGRLAGSLEHLSLESASGWLGGTETEPLLQVTGGRIDNVTAGRGVDLQLQMQSNGGKTLAALLGRPIAYDSLTAEARLGGSLGSLALQNLQAAAAAGDARLEVSGGIGKLAELAQLDLQVAASASSLAGLSPLLGTPLPETPALDLSGHLVGGREAMRIENLSAALGETRLQGALEVALREADVPRLEGSLTAEQLNLDLLWPAAPDGPEAGSGAPTERPELDLPFLSAVDAELRLAADEVIAQGRRFTNASTTLRLQDGRLAINDLTAGVAGGTLAGDAELDAAAPQMAEVVLRLQAEDIELAQLLGGVVPGRVAGRLDVDLNVDSTGRTLDELAANMEGDAAAFGEAGELQGVPLNRMIPDLDITRILPFFRSRETTVRVNCLIGEFDIENGLVRTDSMLDTRRMTLLGEGAVDLADGTLDFELRPIGKSRKLSASSVPVDIGGSLSDPQIRPRVGAAVGGALRGFLGGLLIPINQLTALFGEDARDACGEALRQARDRARARSEDG